MHGIAADDTLGPIVVINESLHCQMIGNISYNNFITTIVAACKIAISEFRSVLCMNAWWINTRDKNKNECYSIKNPISDYRVMHVTVKGYDMLAHNRPSSKVFTASISHGTDGFLGWHSHQKLTNWSSVGSSGVGGWLSVAESTGTVGPSSVVTAAEREQICNFKFGTCMVSMTSLARYEGRQVFLQLQILSLA